MIHVILVVCYIGGDEVAEKSRADYFKQRRETRKAFNVLLDKEKLERFEKKLEEINLTKSEWLNEKIDEELEK